MKLVVLFHHVEVLPHPPVQAGFEGPLHQLEWQLLLLLRKLSLPAVETAVDDRVDRLVCLFHRQPGVGVDGGELLEDLDVVVGIPAARCRRGVSGLHRFAQGLSFLFLLLGLVPLFNLVFEGLVNRFIPIIIDKVLIFLKF